jgi:hypothetical protein
VVHLAVEGGHHAARVIARQRGEDGGKRAFLHDSDVVGSG